MPLLQQHHLLSMFIPYTSSWPFSILPPYFMHLLFLASVFLSPRFVRSKFHAELRGSSGDELPLLVNTLFILQPYQPLYRVSSRQLQSRLPALIMSSDQGFDTNTRSEYTHTCKQLNTEVHQHVEDKQTYTCK